MVMFYAMKNVTRILGLFSGVSFWKLRSGGLGLFGLTNIALLFLGFGLMWLRV
jgi:hypothetical protein